MYNAKIAKNTTGSDKKKNHPHINILRLRDCVRYISILHGFDEKVVCLEYHEQFLICFDLRGEKCKSNNFEGNKVDDTDKHF